MNKYGTELEQVYRSMREARKRKVVHETGDLDAVLFFIDQGIRPEFKTKTPTKVFAPGRGISREGLYVFDPKETKGGFGRYRVHLELTDDDLTVSPEAEQLGYTDIDRVLNTDTGAITVGRLPARVITGIEAYEDGRWTMYDPQEFFKANQGIDLPDALPTPEEYEAALKAKQDELHLWDDKIADAVVTYRRADPKLKARFYDEFLRLTESLDEGRGTSPRDAIDRLEAEALKYDTFEGFKKAFLIQIKHGTYWHVTLDPAFRIDPAKGPRDMSSMSAGASMRVGTLMVTSHLENWADSYAEEGREYAALIDMSAVPAGAYRQVSRGFGNEFMVSDPGAARLVAVMPLDKAVRLDAQINDVIADVAGSREELEALYNAAHGITESLDERRKPPKAIYYHGTSVKNLRHILSQGLIPNPKDKKWAEDPGVGFQTPSRISYGGIYLTQNVTTATSSIPSDERRAKTGVIVIVEVQPRSLTADEDDIVFKLDHFPGASNEAVVIQTYLSYVLGDNPAYVQQQRDKYISNFLEGVNRRLGNAELPPISGQQEARVRAILDDAFFAAVQRRIAYLPSGEKYFARQLAYRGKDVAPMSLPDKNNAEAMFRQVTDQMTRTLRDIYTVKTSDFMQTARTLEPINFKGANKIIAIIELVPSATDEYRSAMRVVYGKVPTVFTDEWKQRQGEVEIVESINEAKWGAIPLGGGERGGVIVHPSTKKKGYVQVTRFTPGGEPAGDDQYASLADALVDHFDLIDHPVTRLWTNNADKLIPAWESATFEHPYADKLTKKRYVYISILRPLAGVSVEGDTSLDSTGSIGVLYRDEPLKPDKIERLNLVPFSEDAKAAFVMEWVATRKPSKYEAIEELGSAGPGKPAYPSDNRPSAAKRGYGHGWRKDRDAYLKAHPVCEVPKCKAKSHSVHHLKALKKGGGNGNGNFQAVCAAHHNTIEKKKPVTEIDYSTYNLWDKLPPATRENVSLAAGFPMGFGMFKRWADISKKERKALKRVWDTAVGESVTEGAQDQKFRHMARTAFRALMTHLNQLNQKRRFKELSGLMPKRAANAVDFPGYDLKFIVDLGNQRSSFGHLKSSGQSIIVLGIPDLTSMDKFAINGDPNATDDKKQQVWNNVLARMESEEEAFLHEFIHYLDDQRAATRVKGQSGRAADQGDAAAYFNNPAEYNAFYQSIVAHFFNNIDTAAKGGPERVTKVFNVLYPRFEDFYKAALGRFMSKEVGGDLWRSLNDTNRRKVKKRLAQTWEDLRQYAIEKGAVLESEAPLETKDYSAVLERISHELWN